MAMLTAFGWVVYIFLVIAAFALLRRIGMAWSVRWVTGFVALGFALYLFSTQVIPPLERSICGYWPKTCPALGRAHGDRDFRYQRETDQPTYGSVARQNQDIYCRNREQSQSQKVNAKLVALQQKQNSNTFTEADEIQEKKLLAAVVEITKARLECEKPIGEAEKEIEKQRKSAKSFLDRFREEKETPRSPGVASLIRVPGTPAPRAIKPTIFTKVGEGRWEGSIDGSNEYGFRDPADGHHTGVFIQPGERLVVRFSGKMPARNWLGDRPSTPCGYGPQVPGDKYTEPNLPAFAIVVTFAPKSGAADQIGKAWPCGAPEMKFQNDKGVPYELVFRYNVAEQYTLNGRRYTDGLVYAGWDGERAQFQVEIVNPALSS